MDPTSRGYLVEEVFEDFRARRGGIIKALTADAQEFYKQCDPQKENLCLYGLPDGEWEVNVPAEEVPPDLPEPAVGINFPRDAMLKKEWLSRVALYSDSWLMAVAFHLGAGFGFNPTEKRRLFDKINGLPSIYEVVSESTVEKQVGGTDNMSNSKPRQSPGGHGSSEATGEKLDEEAPCGVCSKNSSDGGELWIQCDTCEKWFHVECVKISPSKAKHIKQYKCPSCSGNGKRRRPKISLQQLP